MTCLSEEDFRFSSAMPYTWATNVGGVYLIANTVNGNVYVGSTVNLRKRWVWHKHKLRQGQHHSPHLQNAWNLYGEEAFRFVVMQIIDDKQLRLAIEQSLIDVHIRNSLYNVSTTAVSCLGVKRTEETRAKLRKATNQPHRMEHIRNLGKRPKSPEQREMMRLAALRRGPVSEETKGKMRAAWVLRREKQSHGK